jgi:hypothetical protein
MGKKELSLRPLLFKLMLVALVCAIIYGIYNPEVIPHSDVKEKVLGIRTELETNEGWPAKSWDWVQAAATTTYSQIATNVKVPTEISGLPEEVVVEEAVKQLGEKIKSLPAEQAHKAKQHFCADIVAESKSSSDIPSASP